MGLAFEGSQLLKLKLLGEFSGRDSRKAAASFTSSLPCEMCGGPSKGRKIAEHFNRDVVFAHALVGEALTCSATNALGCGDGGNLCSLCLVTGQSHGLAMGVAMSNCSTKNRLAFLKSLLAGGGPLPSRNGKWAAYHEPPAEPRLEGV